MTANPAVDNWQKCLANLVSFVLYSSRPPFSANLRCIWHGSSSALSQLFLHLGAQHASRVLPSQSAQMVGSFQPIAAVTCLFLRRLLRAQILLRLLFRPLQQQLQPLRRRRQSRLQSSLLRLSLHQCQRESPWFRMVRRSISSSQRRSVLLVRWKNSAFDLR